MRTPCRPNRLSVIGGFGLLVATSGGSAADPVTLSGALTIAGASYTTAALMNLTIPSGSPQPLTETVTVGGSTNTYTGVPLWSLLGGTNSGTSDIEIGTQKNATQLDLILATGPGGAASLISAGEIDPFLGGTGQPQPIIVAYQKNGALLGTPELIVPQDSTGTRDVTALTGLDVFGVTPGPNLGGAPTTQFSLSGPGIATQTINQSSLNALSQVTETVTYIAGGGTTTNTFEGPTLCRYWKRPA